MHGIFRGFSTVLQVASDEVKDVNQQRDGQGINYARKAMIRTGMSLNLNGKSEESQLAEELQVLIAKNRAQFEGQAVHTEDAKMESDSDVEQNPGQNPGESNMNRNDNVDIDVT